MLDAALVFALAVTALIFGGAVAVLNFYLSFIRYPVFRWFWFDWQYRHISGIPLLGSVFLVPAAVYFGVTWTPWLLAVALCLLLLDTGGVVWAVPILLREYWRSRANAS
jgi:hypothetical protein